MAKQVITGATLSLGGTDYSAQVDNAEINVSIKEGDTTNFAGSGWEEFVAGMKGFTLTVNFKKDADLSGLDAAIWTEINSGDCIMTFATKTTTAAISTSNPEYQGSVLVTEWQSGPGQLGNVHGGSVTFKGTGSITRDVTP